MSRPNPSPGAGDRSFRPRRPYLSGSLPNLLGDPDPADRAAAAHASAAAILHAAGGPAQDPEVTARLIGLADSVGLEEMAELWRDAGPETLPGTLFSLYLLRTWVHRSSAEVARVYTAGRALAEVSTAVAGVEDPPGPAEVARLGDAVLGSAFQGDFADALHRAAAFCRVVASGRAQLADDSRDTRLAVGNLRMAEQLDRAARMWQAGELI